MKQHSLVAIAAALGAAALAVPAAHAASHDARAQPAARSGHVAAEQRLWAAATANLRASAAVALGVTGGALPPPPPPGPATVRKSITALSAPELASLRKGIAQMIAWNNAPRGSANFKRSLRYWANMHSFVGPNDVPPIVCSKKSGLNNPGMGGLSTQAPTTADEQATWCTCQHGTIQFLTWHRMYLYYFEQVLQAAAGDPNLRLPFWDYETNGHIPDSYRLPTYLIGPVPAANPLYVASRQALLANGSAALDPAVTSTTNAMSKTTYVPFDSALENTPHGAVHCATGVANCPSGYMGYVPTAGNDPIFYAHHTNIDRLYECWLRVNQAARLPSDPNQLAKKFSFIDGSGTLVVRKVGDMLTTAQLGYSYASGGGCPRILHIPIKILRDRPLQIIDLIGPVSLERGTTRVPLRLSPDARRSLLSAAVPEKNAPERQATLVIDGLAFDEIPRVLYKVYLQGADGKRVVVGVINFFNATAPHHDDMPGMDMKEGAGDAGTSFDATDALRTLGSGAGNVMLVIEPATGVTGGTVALAAERISPKANVRFRSARIELR